MAWQDGERWQHDGPAVIAAESVWGTLLDPCGGSTQHGSLPDKGGVCSILVAAFEVCVQRGCFTSTDVARMKAVSKVVGKQVRNEFRLLQIKKATAVCNKVRTAASSLSSGVEGTAGTMTAGNFVRVLDNLNGGIEGKCFLDAGCGCGIPVLIAAYLGARSATGIDTLANLPVYSRIFMTGRMSLGISPETANIGFSDLGEMNFFQHNPDMVYTFWDSIDPNGRQNVVRMTAESTATVFACTNAPGETIDAVCSELNEINSEGNLEAWSLADKFPFSATGGMQRQVWIFRRKLCLFSKKPQSLDFPSDLLVSFVKLGDDNAMPMQLRQRKGSSGKGLSSKDYLVIGEALLNEGFSKVQALAYGGFGRVVRAVHTGRPCVLKIGMDAFSDQDAVNDSLHRECEAMLQLKRQTGMADPHVSAELLPFFGGTSALATINLEEGRKVSVLCMQSCWGDCLSLRMHFRNEFLRDGAVSPNCLLFFQKVLCYVSVLHKKGIAHNDIKWSNILLVTEFLPDEGFNLVFGDFGISMSSSEGSQYVTVLPDSVPKQAARKCSRRAEQCLKNILQQKSLRQPAVLASNRLAKQDLKQAVTSKKPKPSNKPKPAALPIPVTEVMLKKVMDRDQLLLLSAGTPGYRNDVMVKLSIQMSKQATKMDKHLPQVHFVDVCKHDVRAVATMLCEVMRGKSDGAWAKGKKCNSRQYELELDKLKTQQQVSDFLLQGNSVPLRTASQQTKLLCKLVKDMLRSDPNQISAEEAAKHDFFLLASPAKQQYQGTRCKEA
jgi:serine/threonine protein kinase